MKAKKTKKRTPPLLWRLLKRYLENCSIHGVRYLVEDGRHWTERIFWFISCALSWLGCAVMIQGVIWEFDHRRVAVTIQTNYLPYEAQLPSIHFCSRSPPEASTFISNTWGKKVPLSKLINERNGGYFNRLPEPHNAEVFEQFAESLKLDCQQLLVSCDWDGEKVDCCDVFRPFFTTMGYCLSANSVYTNPPSNVSKDWHRKTFYKGPKGNRIFTVKVNMNDKYGLALSKALYVYVLGNMEIPTALTDNGKKLSAKWKSSPSAYIDILQQPTDNEDGMRDIAVEKRNCRFTEENENMRVFSRYGYDACATELDLMSMYNTCGCISHMYPRSSSTPVCNQTQLACVEEWTAGFGNLERDTSKCVPGCEETIYAFIGNYNEVPGEDPVLQFRLLPGPTLRYHRYVVHTKIDVLVAVGSALGLFVGASILSLVEIPYWFFVRRIDDNDQDDNQDNGEKY